MVANTPRTTSRAITVLGANAQLLGQVLHRDSFGNRDIPRDRRRLVADGHARRRSVALHRAFLHPSRHIALSRTARRSSRTASRTRRSRRRQRPSRTYTQRTRSRWAPRASDASAAVHPDEAADATSRRLRPRRALKNWLSRHRPSRQSDARLALPAQAEAPCTPGAGRSAA